jgi:predicted RNA-binding protein YlxR (DUF448 family)
VGCGSHDDAAAMARLVLEEGVVAFDLAGGAFGRGAHVHPRPDCVARAPRGLARAFRQQVAVTGVELGRMLQASADRRIAGLLLAARRCRALDVGAAASLEALGGSRGAAPRPLAIVAVDAGSVATTSEVGRASSEGRAIAWGTKLELGVLLGEEAVALCAVRHEKIALEIQKSCAQADAGRAAAREGAGCRFPEAR